MRISNPWDLDPETTFLNHGSFGACPRAVLEYQSELRAELEREPVRFFLRRYQPLLDAARERVAAFLGSTPRNLVFVNNATFGVNSVLGSLDFEAGDELLVSDHEYNACRNALDHVARRSGARVVVAPLPFPVRDPEHYVEALVSRCSDRTRLLLIDHVTSPTGLVLPLERILAAMKARGIPVCVDGAHAPGMLPLNLRELDPDFYTGNAHKWICSPKGSAILHVADRWLETIRPAVISHGANMPATASSRYHLEFDWTGTQDPSAWLCVPTAIDHLDSLLPGGWAEIRERNRSLVLGARDLLCRRLGIEAPAPAEMIGTLAAFPLPDGDANEPAPLYADPLQERLLDVHGIQVPISPWPAAPKRLCRISAQLYNALEDYERLADALVRELASGPRD